MEIIGMVTWCYATPLTSKRTPNIKKHWHPCWTLFFKIISNDVQIISPEYYCKVEGSKLDPIMGMTAQHFAYLLDHYEGIAQTIPEYFCGNTFIFNVLDNNILSIRLEKGNNLNYLTWLQLNYEEYSDVECDIVDANLFTYDLELRS